jgi:hypothetical protein
MHLGWHLSLCGVALNYNLAEQTEVETTLIATALVLVVKFYRRLVKDQID